jgi:Dolichyl-phosphate-mannose-protein mannosyltransferase
MVRPNQNAERADLYFSATLGLVALVPRLFVAIAWAREPVWDGHYYHYGAERIARGLGYSEDVLSHGHLLWKPWCHYPVGYSALLGAVYRVFGPGLVVAPVLNALIGTALVVITHRLARYYLSETRARIAGTLAALHPGLIAYSAVVMTEPLAALLLASAALVAARWHARLPGLLAAGAVLGLATLVRPATLLAAPLLLFMETGGWKRAVPRAAAATLAAIVVVSPWTVRNCRVMDGCAFVSTNGGWNLAIGAVYDSGRFETLRARDGCPIVTGQVQQDRCWAKVGLARIEKAPLHWLSLMPKKLGHTYDHESFAIEYLREADPAAWPEARRVAGRQLDTAFHRLLLVIAGLTVVGFVSWRRRDAAFWSQASTLGVLALLALYATLSERHPYFWIAALLPLIPLLPLPGRPRQGAMGRYLLGLLAATSLVHAVFFGDDRYHVVVSWVLCIFAAGALRSAHETPANGF